MLFWECSIIQKTAVHCNPSPHPSSCHIIPQYYVYLSKPDQSTNHDLLLLLLCEYLKITIVGDIHGQLNDLLTVFYFGGKYNGIYFESLGQQIVRAWSTIG